MHLILWTCALSGSLGSFELDFLIHWTFICSFQSLPLPFVTWVACLEHLPLETHAKKLLSTSTSSVFWVTRSAVSFCG